jgi:hypothetical protein
MMPKSPQASSDGLTVAQGPLHDQYVLLSVATLLLLRSSPPMALHQSGLLAGPPGLQGHLRTSFIAGLVPLMTSITLDMSEASSSIDLPVPPVHPRLLLSSCHHHLLPC